MRSYSHSLLGAGVGALVGNVMGIGFVLPAIVGMVAGLLPDVDEPSSAAGRAFGVWSKKMKNSWGHRTYTHTVYAVAITTIVMYISFRGIFVMLGLFPPGPYSLVVLAGLLSHIIADMTTRSGIYLFYPAKKLFFAGRWEADGKKEEIIVSLFGFVLLFVAFINS